MSSPMGLRARRDSLTSISTSSQVDKAQLAQALDKIHTSASQSDALTTFNDFAPPPGSAPPAESKGTAGDLVQAGLSGLYSRLKEAVGVVGKTPAQEPGEPSSPDPTSKRSSVMSTGNNVAKQSSAASLPRGDSGGTSSTFGSSTASDALHATSSSSGAITNDSHSQAPRSSKASSITTMTASKSTSSSGQNLPKMAKAVVSSVANPSLAPITVSAFKDKDAARGVTTRVEEGPLSARGRGIGKTSEDPGTLLPGTTHSQESLDVRLPPHPSRARREDGASIDGGSDAPLSPVKGSAASISTQHSGDTSIRSMRPSVQGTRLASRETLKKPAVIDRISRSRTPGDSRSRSSSMEPGMAEPSPISTSAHNSVYHDSFAQHEKPEHLPSGKLRIPGTTANEGATQTVSARLESMRKQVVSKEFWMADETCKECFLCGQPFSAFRRKHHCRTCGCIFDSKCTSTISGQKFGVPGTLRVCKTCLDIINRRYDSGSDDSGDDSYLPAIFRSGLKATPASRSRADDETSIYERMEDGGENSRSTTTPMMAIPATRRIGDSKILEIDAPQLSRPSSSRSLKSLAGRPLSSGHRRTNSKPHFLGRFRSPAEDRAPFRKAVGEELGRNSKLPAFHDDNIIDPELEPYMSEESSGDEQMSIFATMASSDIMPSSLDPDKSNFGPFLSAGKRHRMRPGEKSISGLSFTSRGLDDSAGPVTSMISHSRPARRRNLSTTSASQHHVMRSPRPRSGVYPKGFSASGELLANFESTNAPVVEATKLTRSDSIRQAARPPEVQLSPSSLKHVRKLLRQLLQDAQVPNVSAWDKALIPILLRCADDVAPDIRRGDSMDIRTYVKLKKIPGSKPGDTSYVSGLIFTKNLALKSMPRSILNPRIIIISFPIEYQRQQHHFMSLQPVIEQEKEFLRVVVNRIIALRPQVLLAEKSVAGVALQYLSEANIAVAYNVKSSMVDAVSRFSGAEIISSLDMLALPNRVGAAGGFEVKTFVNKEVPGRKKTYIFISGCERDLGCTIALRGAPTPVLTSVKRITEFMVYVVYNLKLESCLMRDEYIKLPDEVDGAASVSLPSTSREPTDESLLSMGSASVEAAADNPPVLITHPSNEGDSQRTHSSEESAPDLAPTSSSAAQPSASDPDTGLNLNTQMPLNTSEPGVEPPPPPSPQQQQQLLPTTARLVSMHASHSRASHESPVPEDVPMPTFYSDMVAKYETKILSASPFVKFTQPYLLMKAREQERRLVYLKQLRDQDLVEEHRENEKPKPDRFQLIKPEMVHEIGQKAPRQIMEVLHAVHDAEYDKALYNYKTQTRHWENYIQGNLDLFDPYSHQNIVVLYSVICTETKIPCTEPGLIAIGFYDDEPNEGRLMDADWRLGHYVENICMGAYDMCHANGCDRPMWQHHRTYVHEEARITMFIEKDSPLPGTMQVEEDNNDIYMWNYCKMCNKDLGLQAMSESTWKYSFGKYLELSFWGKGLQLHPASDCPHDHQLDHIKYFNFRGTSIRIHYDPIDLLEIIVPRARITWKVDHDLGLKNEIFTKSEERWNRFMSSVRARLKSIRIDSVLPEKSESCKAEVERLTKKAQEDQPELIRKLQGAYMGSKYYEVIPMNPIIREMLERVSEWDAAFAKFEADFLSDKDVRQLTLIQLKKMFGDNESKESLPSTDGTGTGTGTGTSIISTAGSETDERTVATTQTSISEDLDEKHISTSQPSDAAASVTGGTVPPSLVGDQAASLDLDGSVNRGSDNNNNNNNNLCNKSQVADAVLDAVEPLDLATSPRSPLSAKSKPLFPPDHGPGMTGSRIPGAPTALSESSTAPASGAAHDTDTGSGVAPSQPVPSQQGQQGQQGQQIQQGQQHLQNQIIPGPSLPPPKSAPSLTEKVEQMRREFRTLSGETSQIVAALEAQAEQQQQQQKSALPVQVLVPERGSSRRAGLNVSPPIVRAISQPAVPFARSQSSLGKQPPPGKDGRPADSGPAGDLTRTSAEGSGTVKSEKKLSDRLGLGALKSHRKAGQSSIPRYVHGKKKESKVSALAKHFEQLSREFERERMRDRKQRAAKMHYSRAFLPRTSTKATVEVYEDVDQAVQELNHEDDHLLERDQEQEQGQGQEQGQERASNSSNKDATIEAAETATEPPAARIIKSSDRLERPTSPVTTSPAEIPSQPDELSTEGEGEGEGEADDDNKHDGSRGASDDEGASDGDQSSLLEDMLHIPESLEPSGEIPKYQKSSLMKMLTNFWAERSASGWPQLEYPVNATDHIFIDSDVIVREDEPSSLIAFALSSTDYQAKVADIRHSWKMAARGAAVAMDEADGADGTDGMDIDGTDGMDIDGTDGGDGGESGGGEGTGMSSAVSDMSTADVLFADEEELEKSLLRSTGTHLKYQFTEGSARMLCKIFYAEQFDALRRKCGVADRIVESLSRCLKWDSRGGKTKSVFLKTLDDRLVMKSLSPIETAAFLRFAPAYFNIMAEALFHDLPSVIAKMLGFFQVIIKNPVTNTEIKLDLLVMENLFYDRSPDRIFDLKGSMRNRKIQSTGEQNEVLLDENMVEYIYESPLFAREHSKKILRASVWNDTLFLARQNVMDYSLMVAVDEAKKELVVGIIDCIRTYTWDKKLESWIKDRGFAGGGRNRPTVTSPKEYKSRFREAMARYILQAPNCWHQFGSPSSSTPVVARTRFEELPPRGE